MRKILMRQKCNTREHRRGFTLIEILLAMAVSSILLVGASFFLWQIGQLYFLEQTGPAYEQHALNVTRFLEHTFSSAQPSTENTSGDQSENQYQAIAWKALPNARYGDDDLLSFSYDEPLAIIYWEEGPLPRIHAYLHFDEEEGLFLLWQTDAQQREGSDTVQKSLISPFVKAITYESYDDNFDEWKNRDKFLDDDNDGNMIPDIIRLTFTWPDGHEEKTMLLLPPQQTHAIIY